MKHSLFIIFCVVMGISTACWSGKTIANENRKSYQQITVSAWNEYTVNSYQFVLKQDSKFVYTVIRNDSIKSEKRYYGIITNQPFSDTLFLKYTGKTQLNGAANFLIREASGGYLIQQFKNNTKSVFMRIRRLGHRF